MYRVIKYFTDLQDNNHAYNAGDVFPRDGVEVTEERIKELSSDANRQHAPLIVEETTVAPQSDETPSTDESVVEEKKAPKKSNKKEK